MTTHGISVTMDYRSRHAVRCAVHCCRPFASD